MTEKKPIQSAKTIGIEAVSILEWMCEIVRVWMMKLFSKVRGINSIALRIMAFCVAALVMWIVWPLVILTIIVFGIVWAKRMKLWSTKTIDIKKEDEAGD